MPDLVCVDWNMPVMDGLQFVSAVRSNPAWRQVIMMVTSESEHGQIVRAGHGAHEYVIKPFTADAIRDKLALLGLLPQEVALERAPGHRRASPRRRRALSITDLIDEETVQSIAQEAWSALVGDDEFLVPLPGGTPTTPSAVGRGRRPWTAPSSSPAAGRRPRSWPAACSRSTPPGARRRGRRGRPR